MTKMFYSCKHLLLFVAWALLIFSGCTNQTTPGIIPEHPDFAQHIAPLVYKKCMPCHRPGSGGPFNLVTWNDFKRHASTVKLMVVSRTMPPWPADPSYSHFCDEKCLTDDDVSLITQWIEDGAPEGDASKTPSPPQFPDGSRIGKPDIVLRLKEPFPLKGDNIDKFMMMKIPYVLPRDTVIKEIEIIPGNKKIVHHINAHLVQYDTESKKDFSKGEWFVNTELFDKRQAFEKLDLANDDGSYPLLTPSVSNYLPGVETAVYPEGIGGHRVKKNGILLLDNIHYGPTPIDTSDQTSFNIFFGAGSPKRPTREFILGTSGISKIEPPLVIPPNTVQTFRTFYKVPENISILTINPHMHLLGEKFLAYAITPAGDTVHLIRILKWDFRWQYFYTFPKMLKIPKGSVLIAEGVYDNTENNPLNPFHPPRVVAEREGSMRTTDEMFQLIVTWLPYQEGDEKISLENPK